MPHKKPASNDNQDPAPHTLGQSEWNENRKSWVSHRHCMCTHTCRVIYKHTHIRAALVYLPRTCHCESVVNIYDGLALQGEQQTLSSHQRTNSNPSRSPCFPSRLKRGGKRERKSDNPKISGKTVWRVPDVALRQHFMTFPWLPSNTVGASPNTPHTSLLPGLLMFSQRRRAGRFSHYRCRQQIIQWKQDSFQMLHGTLRYNYH